MVPAYALRTVLSSTSCQRGLLDIPSSPSASFGSFQRGLIHLVYNVNNTWTFYMQTRDGGLTWSAARNISAMVTRPGWGWMAVGPNHGLATRAGRLLVPFNTFLEESEITRDHMRSQLEEAEITRDHMRSQLEEAEQRMAQMSKQLDECEVQKQQVQKLPNKEECEVQEAAGAEAAKLGKSARCRSSRCSWRM